MLLETLSGGFQKWAGTDLATSTYSVTIAPTTTEPVASATRAILDLHAGGSSVQNLIECMPILTGQDDAIITGFRVYGWRKIAGTNLNTAKDTWIPKLMFEMAGVVGSLTGAALGVIPATYFFFDTITMVNPASAPNWMEVFSPVSVTANLPGWFRFDAMGHPKLEVVVDLGANATGFNILVGKY